jgi:hypothetical protein
VKPKAAQLELEEVEVWHSYADNDVEERWTSNSPCIRLNLLPSIYYYLYNLFVLDQRNFVMAAGKVLTDAIVIPYFFLVPHFSHGKGQMFVQRGNCFETMRVTSYLRLRRLVAGLSPQRPGFSPGSVNVKLWWNK